MQLGAERFSHLNMDMVRLSSGLSKPMSCHAVRRRGQLGTGLNHRWTGMGRCSVIRFPSPES